MPGPSFPTSPSQDVVGVFDVNFNQLFVSARPVKATVKEGGKLAKHPIETGNTMTDNRITLPVEIQLSIICDPANYRDTFKQIKTAYQSLTPLYVQLKADSYDNMFIEDLPHEETPDMFDTIAIGLKLSRVIFVTAQYAQLPPANVKKASNASTVKTGQKEGAAATTTQTSVGYDLLFGSKP